MIDQRNLRSKRKQRRKQTAEDFTPVWLVNEILDKLGEYSKEAWEDPRKTFIDPACGNGNFLVEVAKKKLRLGHRPYDVAKTVFGLDIMLDNVIEARFRLYRIFDMYNGLTEDVVREVWKNVKKVEDTLKVDFNQSVFKNKHLTSEKIKEIIRKVSQMNQGREKVRAKARSLIFKDSFYNNEHVEDIQTVHTPFDLTNSIVEKLGEYISLTDGKKYICFNYEFAEALVAKGVAKGKITFISECESKVAYTQQVLGVKGIIDNFVERKFRGKFDVIVGNPPYQKPQETKGKRGGGATLWDKFVEKSIEICKDGGFISLIHPCGWRAPKGIYKNTKKKMMENQIHYLEIHNAKDGLKTFNAGTRYDWYVMEKSEPYTNTKIVAEDGCKYDKNISNLPFIPNAMFDEVMGLLAGDGEETVDVLSSCSYHTQQGTKKGYISKVKNSKFKYTVVHNVKVSGETSVVYSSQDRGHFGTSKVIFGRRQCGVLSDASGNYAVSQDCRAIICNEDEAENIKKALLNPSFIELSLVCSHGGTANDNYNKDVLALFRKDFWKDFI